MPRTWAAKLVLASLLGILLAAAATELADARPGGGHSYSGGSHSSSSGGYRSSSGSSGSSDGTDDGGTGFVIGVGVIVTLCLVSVALENKKTGPTWTSSTVRPAGSFEVAALRGADPAFSQVAFEDFAFNLFARAQRARGKRSELEALTPYFAPDILEMLAKATPVSAVVIGSLRMLTVTAPKDAPTHTIAVRFEANLANPNGTVNVIELWSFARDAKLQSRVPDATRTLPCPNCNAPFKAATERTCAHCNTRIEASRFDWAVFTREIGAETSVGVTLTGTTAEVGNDLTTIYADDVIPQLQALYQADPNVTWPSLEGHISMIYHRLNEGWNKKDLTPVRGLVTHSLLGYLQFWIDEYSRQGLANRLDGATIRRIHAAKVTRDPYFDAITVRVFANGHDYTVDSKGSVVGGSKTARREYTEYWTLIRAAGRKGPIVNEPKCPNCGAPLTISNAGDCTHCNAHVESGRFDWVLSKIEQDEVYTG